MTEQRHKASGSPRAPDSARTSGSARAMGAPRAVDAARALDSEVLDSARAEDSARVPGSARALGSARVLSSSLEDYLEAIFNLAADNDNNFARAKDIAEVMGVAKPSVTGALRVLSEKGLVHYRPYGFVSLTDAGYSMAESVARKHEVIRSFFADVLGVETVLAHKAACEVEHSLGPEIMSRLVDFLEFLTDGSAERQIAAEFRDFCRSKLQDDNNQDENR